MTAPAAKPAAAIAGAITARCQSIPWTTRRSGTPTNTILRPPRLTGARALAVSSWQPATQRRPQHRQRLQLQLQHQPQPRLRRLQLPQQQQLRLLRQRPQRRQPHLQELPLSWSSMVDSKAACRPGWCPVPAPFTLITATILTAGRATFISAWTTMCRDKPTKQSRFRWRPREIWLSGSTAVRKRVPQQRTISYTSKSATPVAHCFKLSRPTATGTRRRLEITHRNRLALLLTRGRLSDCNSVARLTFRCRRPSG